MFPCVLINATSRELTVVAVFFDRLIQYLLSSVSLIFASTKALCVFEKNPVCLSVYNSLYQSMGKPLQIAISLTRLQSNGDQATTQSSNSEYEEFDHSHTYVAHRTVERVPLLTDNNTYRVILRRKSKYDGLLGKSFNNNSRVECPGFRKVPDLEPLRGTPRLSIEFCTDEVYLKRHEKYEKQEKMIKRRDRIRQREEQYRFVA
ncbi:unnamed protein product [Thelazia callipaeda]|uniref:PEHE domain-containing protein n=1 Tax=Thelazia callipaeda TaxID=103827 RepID=A0A0N5CNV9_THECL|nr:unnamed protein product [Thelazia callipaeda]